MPRAVPTPRIPESLRADGIRGTVPEPFPPFLGLADRTKLTRIGGVDSGSVLPRNPTFRRTNGVGSEPTLSTVARGGGVPVTVSHMASTKNRN